MLKMLRQLFLDKSGATAIEYGLIVALVVIAIIVSMSSVANESTGLWARVTDKTTVALNGPGT